METLKVKAVTHEGVQRWGITDGKRWFYWCYTSEGIAREVSKKMTEGGWSRTQHEVNICYDKPRLLSPYQGE